MKIQHNVIAFYSRFDHVTFSRVKMGVAVFYSMYHVILFRKETKLSVAFFFLAVIVGQFDKFDLSTKCDLWKSRSATFFLLHCMFFFFFPLVEMSLKKNAYENSTQCDLFLIAILPCDLFAGNNGSGSFSTQCIT